MKVLLTEFQEKHKDSLRWMMFGGWGSGRTTTMAILFLEHAAENVLQEVHIYDHGFGSKRSIIGQVRLVFEENYSDEFELFVTNRRGTFSIVLKRKSKKMSMNAHELYDERERLRFLLDHCDFIKEHGLSHRQKEVVSLARAGGTLDSIRLSDIFSISIQSASQTLTAIWRKGFLTREDIGDKSGGSLYVYRYALGKRL